MTDINTWNEAIKLGDKTEIIDSAILLFLCKIASTGSDVHQGLRWEEFRNANGGIEKLKKLHDKAIEEYETWLSENDYLDD